VRYVPTWKGNRELPEDEQLALEIRRLRPVDDLATISNADMLRWRDKELKVWIDKPEYKEQILGASVDALRMLRRLKDDTRNWEHFEFERGGSWVALDDPIEIFLHGPSPLGQDQTEGLFAEIFRAMNDIASATEDELKNLIAQCGGTSSESAEDTDARTVPADAAPTSADTLLEPSAPSS
jgi:hypothetical protein